MPRFTLLIPRPGGNNTLTDVLSFVDLRNRNKILREALWFPLGGSLLILSNGFSRDEHLSLLREFPEGSRLISVLDEAPYIAYLTILHILSKSGEAFYFEEGNEGEYCAAILRPKDAMRYVLTYPAAIRELAEVAIYLRNYNAIPAIFNDVVISVLPCDQLEVLEKLKDDFSIIVKRAYRSAGLLPLFP